MTKTLCLSVLLLASIVLTYAIVRGPRDAEAAPIVANDKIVAPMEGVTDFTVDGRKSLFRLTISTPTGGTISNPAVIGTARLLGTADITVVGPGGEPRDGAMIREYVFRGTGPGKARIVFQRTGPSSDKAQAVTFNVTVK
jgi:hypothetical protein